ncbi:MAG: bacterial transcriptional activator domain-containing protein [Bacteroidota bacterium]
MDHYKKQIATLLDHRKNAAIQVQCLGNFQVWRERNLISSKDWGRDKTVQLFQFFITSRHRNALHKEQVIDRIWEAVDQKAGQQNFKVALHGINKVLEPERKSRSESKYLIRQGLTYQLNFDNIWIDAQALEQFIAIGNQALTDDLEQAKVAYREAIDLYRGIYLPNRLYEDWSSEERERIQVLILGTLISLSELLIEENPQESIRLAQQALQIDAAWEDAYRVQMEAYFKRGNRPMAIKTYQQCLKVLDEEFGIEPLPETKRLMHQIQGK